VGEGNALSTLERFSSRHNKETGYKKKHETTNM